MLCLLAWACSSGQRADSEFSIEAENPAYGEGQGPVVLVDAAHHNFHTADGRYQAFADLLRSDGYVVESNEAKFDKAALEKGQILVISNALSEKDAQWEDWPNPTYPAFEDAEVEAVRRWVEEGGSLLLIADHMPLPAAAENLAAAFGVRFNNGYAVRADRSRNRPPLKFRPDGSGESADGVLGSHPITEGRNASERVTVVATFTGQAFQADQGTPLLTFGPSIISLMTEIPAKFEEDTPRVDVEGWYQGLVMPYGQGRAAFFGEAAMFTAQISGSGNTMGMNSPHAPDNAQFLLNVMHWLSGLLP
ncbi:MAG TPA: DUF4350 domain-containing protein [Acidobacteriota bacterium]|nr:DUF4350 domain-containing protein [Acidobacteriota bacterium]